MLKMVSGFFDDMLRLPQTAGVADPNVRRDGVSVLVMPEPNTVLFRLLRLAYPAECLDADHFTLVVAADLDGIFSVHEAAHKYRFFRVERLINGMLANSILIDAYSHRFFAIAQLRDLPQLTRAAARSALKLSIHAEVFSFPEMGLLTWSEAHRLDKFQRLCGIEADLIVRVELFCELLDDETPVWWARRGHSDACGPRWESYRIFSGMYQRREIPAQRFRNHIGLLASQVQLRPSHHAVELEALNIAAANRAIIDACPLCFRKADRHLAILADRLALLIKESNEKLVKTL
ncbi:hypothetical protein B0H14DRAFT_2448971 [Mycena olivaceomarginata]|nr:hypothetical protein B0H14DRAFT_2448971 [Mycena olivaceomarginata]